MNYSLLPFPTFSQTADNEGRPDLRDALAKRQRDVAHNAVNNLDLLNHVVDTLCDLPWKFCVDHCHERDGQLHLSVMARNLGRNLAVGDTVNAGFFLRNVETGHVQTLACTRLFRVSCENGALLECEQDQSYTNLRSEIAPTDWKLKITHVINRSFSGDGVDLDVARFHATTHQMVITPYEFLCQLSAQGLIDDEEQSDIQVAFDEAADF